jgi:hypothetical protein
MDEARRRMQEDRQQDRRTDSQPKPADMQADGQAEGRCRTVPQVGGAVRALARRGVELAVVLGVVDAVRLRPHVEAQHITGRYLVRGARRHPAVLVGQQRRQTVVALALRGGERRGNLR